MDSKPLAPTLVRLPRHSQRGRAGRYRNGPVCDACNKPAGEGYITDGEVCGGGDGPGFILCHRLRCAAKRSGTVEERRALYAAKRAERKAG